MSFSHPALDSAAQELTQLQHAAQRVGCIDPVEALRPLDCRPEAVRSGARHMDVAAKHVGAASERVHHARATADRSWDDKAGDAYQNSAAGLEHDHKLTRHRTEDTADAGEQIADGLDNIAKTAADRSSGIAGESQQAAVMVLEGPEAAGAAPRVPPGTRPDDPARQEALVRVRREAEQQVRQACDQVADVARRGEAQVAEQGARLQGLTEPISPIQV